METNAGSGTGAGAGTAGSGQETGEGAALAVNGRAPKTGYDRDQFGSPWADTDSNAYDTRDVM